MKSIPQIIEEQVHRWQILQKEEKEEKQGVSIITVSREPGSGGGLVAARLAEKLALTFSIRKSSMKWPKAPTSAKNW